MKAILSLLAVLEFLKAGADVHAQGGGLDAYGWHHNRQLGSYHCYRGPLAGRAIVSKEEILRGLQGQGSVKSAPQPQLSRGLFHFLELV
jgi:hypothetical protein